MTYHDKTCLSHTTKRDLISPKLSGKTFLQKAALSVTDSSFSIAFLQIHV